MKNFNSVTIQYPDSPCVRGAVQIAKTLKKAGFHAWFVGGFVRDLLLGRTPHDIDLCTDALPADVQACFSHTLELGASFGIISVEQDGTFYEVATLREEREYMDGRHPEKVTYTNDPQLDVIRRDFTSNALLYDPESCQVLDYCGGIDDIRHGILRAVGNPGQRFEEDCLRMLRAVRFAARYRWIPDPETFRAIKQQASSIHKISMERIRDEVEKMLIGPNPSYAFEMLSDLGLLKEILPEVEALRGMEQPKAFHPEGDVFVHTMLMLDHLGWPDRILAWSALLHDIGKAVTQTWKDGVPHFYGHESIGADMAIPLLQRFRMASADITAVSNAIRNHMRFAHVDCMKQSTWKKMIHAPNFPMELHLNRLDRFSSHRLMGSYILLLDRIKSDAENSGTALPARFINGNDLISMGMKPGKAMGALLTELFDKQLDGEFSTKEDAEIFAKEKIKAEIKK